MAERGTKKTSQPAEHDTENQPPTPKQFLKKLSDLHHHRLRELERHDDDEHALFKRLEEHFAYMSNQLKAFFRNEEIWKPSTANTKTPRETRKDMELDGRHQAIDDPGAVTITADQPSRGSKDATGKEDITRANDGKADCRKGTNTDVDAASQKKPKRKPSKPTREPQARKVRATNAAQPKNIDTGK
ncbi:hypothetical protein DM02DRAFT_648833 [Periconia macrospinosa]|uniref:Uncharacterized protein n=1 Tax=Periconia macrospinosa TaxID=97972 RepID=A0A2V1EDA8_9PLEO|nr:hypothetical protein DM02DRAFT_648833 [Periconia macrospinosa]